MISIRLLSILLVGTALLRGIVAEECDDLGAAFGYCVGIEGCADSCSDVAFLTEIRTVEEIELSCQDLKDAVASKTYIQYCSFVNCCPACVDSGVAYGTCTVKFQDKDGCDVEEICKDAVAQQPTTSQEEMTNSGSLSMKGTITRASVIGAAFAMYALN